MRSIMKNKFKNIILFTIIFIYFIYCITNNTYITKQTIYSFNLWLTKIIPSLFPTFIIVDLIYNSNLIKGRYYVRVYNEK